MQRLSAEDVENVLADDDSFDAQLFTTILDAIQHDKLRGQTALQEAARAALEGGLVRHGRKINTQAIRTVVPSTDAEAALLARSSGAAQPDSEAELDSAEGASSGGEVEVEMRLVVGQLRLEMPWLRCLWNHVRQMLGGLWPARGMEPVAGPRRHSLAKRHAAHASPSVPHQVHEVGLNYCLLARALGYCSLGKHFDVEKDFGSVIKCRDERTITFILCA